MNLNSLNKNYNVIANEFGASRDNLHWPLLDLFFEQIKDLKNPRILDLGCGGGRFYEYLLKKSQELNWSFEYLGIDQSVELVKLAQEKYGQIVIPGQAPLGVQNPESHKLNPYPNLFKVLDWQNLEQLETESFDAVISLAVFHHLEKSKQSEALQKLAKVLKNDGRLCLTVWNLWNYHRHKNWWSFVKDRLFLSADKFFSKYQFHKKDLQTWQDTLMLWRNKTPLFYYNFRKNELKKLAETIGFSDIICQYENNSWRQANNLYLIAKK